MFNWLRRTWIKYITWPRYRRRLRDGVVAVMWLNDVLIKEGWKRQRRRNLLRDLQGDPQKMVWILDALYTGRLPRKIGGGL
jgi:hypothetical protein